MKKKKVSIREVAVFLLALLMVLSLIVPSLLTLIEIVGQSK